MRDEGEPLTAGTWGCMVLVVLAQVYSVAACVAGWWR